MESDSDEIRRDSSIAHACFLLLLQRRRADVWSETWNELLIDDNLFTPVHMVSNARKIERTTPLHEMIGSKPIALSRQLPRSLLLRIEGTIGRINRRANSLPMALAIATTSTSAPISPISLPEQDLQLQVAEDIQEPTSSPPSPPSPPPSLSVVEQVTPPSSMIRLQSSNTDPLRSTSSSSILQDQSLNPTETLTYPNSPPRPRNVLTLDAAALLATLSSSSTSNLPVLRPSPARTPFNLPSSSRHTPTLTAADKEALAQSSVKRGHLPPPNRSSSLSSALRCLPLSSSPAPSHPLSINSRLGPRQPSSPVVLPPVSVVTVVGLQRTRSISHSSSSVITDQELDEVRTSPALPCSLYKQDAACSPDHKALLTSSSSLSPTPFQEEFGTWTQERLRGRRNIVLSRKSSHHFSRQDEARDGDKGSPLPPTVPPPPPPPPPPHSSDAISVGAHAVDSSNTCILPNAAFPFSSLHGQQPSGLHNLSIIAPPSDRLPTMRSPLASSSPGSPNLPSVVSAPGPASKSILRQNFASRAEALKAAQQWSRFQYGQGP